MKKAFFILAGIIAPLAMFAQTNWKIDPAHSSVNFTVTHLVISEVEGSFKEFNGSISTSSADFENAQIEFSVNVSSINTNNDMRDNHLRSADFFDAAKFPKMTFKSKSFKKVSGNKYELTGDLSIRDVTKSVKFEVTYGGTAKDGYGNTKAGFKAKSVINRIDYGLKWNPVTEAGGAVVSPEVNIELRLQFNQEK